MVKPNINRGKLLAWSFRVAVAVLVLLGAYALISPAFSKVKSNWDVLQFAMEKPEFVRVLKEDYASKSAELDNSFKTKQPDRRDQIIEKVAKQLEAGK